MAEVGNCLRFYLKYPAEMERLYDTDEPVTDGLPNPDETLGKVRRVGDAASREALPQPKRLHPPLRGRCRQSRRRGFQPERRSIRAPTAW